MQAIHLSFQVERCEIMNILSDLYNIDTQSPSIYISQINISLILSYIKTRVSDQLPDVHNGRNTQTRLHNPVPGLINLIITEDGTCANPTNP